MSRQVYVETYGCQMNAHDSSKILELLNARGYEHTTHIEQADVVVINTCSVRELAVQKAYSQIGTLKDIKAQKNTKIVVTGCVAQLEGDQILKRFNNVDLVLGPDNIYQIGDLIERTYLNERLVRAELDESPGFQFLSSVPTTKNNRISGFVTVQKGCDKNCSYCIVPQVRGREVSRPLEEITQEISNLVSSGIRDITLLGQNIDAYRDPKDRRFDVLLHEASQVKGLNRLRFTTGHPNDFNEKMANVMATSPTLCEHLHLPVQSGSDAVLKKMYRGYTRARYLEKINMVRDKIPDLAITSDLIVGFPGETEEDFEQTLDLVKLAGFDAAFCYSYSVRPDTKAQLLFKDTVTEKEKRIRLQKLIDLVRQTALARADRFVGRTMEVLVEGPSRLQPNHLTGRIRHNTVVNFAGHSPIKPGMLIPVKIERNINGFSLWGCVAD